MNRADLKADINTRIRQMVAVDAISPAILADILDSMTDGIFPVQQVEFAFDDSGGITLVPESENMYEAIGSNDLNEAYGYGNVFIAQDSDGWISMRFNDDPLKKLLLGFSDISSGAQDYHNLIAAVIIEEGILKAVDGGTVYDLGYLDPWVEFAKLERTTAGVFKLWVKVDGSDEGYQLKRTFTFSSLVQLFVFGQIGYGYMYSPESYNLMTND